jgi:hypothetical protein
MNQAEAMKMMVKVPPDVRQYLEETAAYNITSMTAEIVRSVRDRMAREQREKAVR